MTTLEIFIRMFLKKYWWCRKNHQWATQSSHARNYTCTTTQKDL